MGKVKRFYRKSDGVYFVPGEVVHGMGGEFCRIKKIVYCKMYLSRYKVVFSVNPVHYVSMAFINKVGYLCPPMHGCKGVSPVALHRNVFVTK